MGKQRKCSLYLSSGHPRLGFHFGFLTLAAVFFAQHLASNPCFGQGVASWKDRLKNEAPVKWDEYLVAGKYLQGSCETTSVHVYAGKEVKETWRTDARQSERGAVVTVQPPSGVRTRGRTDAINSKYAFRLERKTADSPWFISELGLDVSKGYQLDIWSPDARIQLYFLAAALTFSGTQEYLPAMVKDADFSVEKTTQVQMAERELVRFDFRYRPKELPEREFKGRKFGGWNPIRGGWVTLDPERYWVICDYEVSVEWQDQSTGIMAGALSYQKEDNGFPTLSTIERRYEGITKKGIATKRTDKEQFKLTHQKMDEREFTLSAFGLPEPMGVSWTRPTRWWLWIALTAFGTFGLGVVVKIVKRRYVKDGAVRK
jgi:hypothetical protein